MTTRVKRVFEVVAHQAISILSIFWAARLACALACLVALSAGAQYSPPSSGLIAWWRGDGDATDSSGNGHNGALQNGMGFTAGMFGQAFNAGSNKRVAVPDSPAFVLTSSLTIGAWVNARANGYCILFRGDNRTGLDPFQLGGDAAGNFLFTIQQSATVEKTLSVPYVYNQWIHLTGTLDGSTGDMRIYTNGVLAAQAFTSVRPLGALDPGQAPGIGIGNTQNNPYDFSFQGAIDEVVLYNRALSPQEVLSLVPEPSSTALVCCFLGALGWLKALGARKTVLGRKPSSVA